MTETVFEPVHTVTDYYDKPIRGVADFHGRPHVYEAEWSDDAGEYTSTFRLKPLPHDALHLVLEAWHIWCSWKAAFDQGRAALDSHPALPEHRARHEQLQPLLADVLAIDPDCCIRTHAAFQRTAGFDSLVSHPVTLEVKWEPIP